MQTKCNLYIHLSRVVVLLFCAGIFSLSCSSQSLNKATTPNNRQLKVVTVSGNGYQRGLQHGQQLKKEIAEVMVLWKSNLQKSAQMPIDSFLQQFFANTDFTPALKKYTPDILEEVRGMADGAGQPYNDMLAFQLVDEYWVYRDKLRNDSTLHHCSDIGVSARNGKPAYVAQNMDLESWMDGYQIVLHIKPHGNTPEQYLLSCAGLVGLNGINEHGVGVCVNTLMQLSASGDGLPVAFVIRGLLERKDRKGVLQFLQNTKHASGQNYIVGIVDSVYNYEASAGKVVRMPSDAAGAVYHTNHPVVNNDVKPWYNKYYRRYLQGLTKGNNSEVRLAALKKRAGEAPSLDDSFIKNTLRSKDDPNHPVCRANEAGKGGFTFGSVVLTLSGKRIMEVTAGPPDESEYQTFSFEKKK